MNTSPPFSSHCTGYLSYSELISKVFKCLRGIAPSYITGLLIPHISARDLRSAHQLLVLVPRVTRETEGGRTFSLRAPRLWNNPTMRIRQATSWSSFKSCFYNMGLFRRFLMSLVMSFFGFYVCEALCKLVFEKCYILKFYYVCSNALHYTYIIVIIILLYYYYYYYYYYIITKLEGKALHTYSLLLLSTAAHKVLNLQSECTVVLCQAYIYKVHICTVTLNT